MDEITRPRRGRPRKAVADAVAPEQARSDDQVDAGHGQAGDEGLGIQALDAGARQVIDWHSMSALVMAKHNRAHQIACIWHPEAVGTVFDTPHLGSIRVLVGPAQYQLSTGEVVAVFATFFDS